MADRPDRSKIALDAAGELEQRVILVLDKDSGWQQANGEEGVVVGSKKRGLFWQRNLDGSGPRKVDDTSERYEVRWRVGSACMRRGRERDE